MIYQRIFEAEGDEDQDDGTLFSLSAEFLEAALVLRATPPVRIGYSSAMYYLLAHSAELMLKAFLYKHGQTISSLRKINHDLEKLASLAREKGLPEKVRLIHVCQFSGTYKDKGFEYRTKVKRTFPNLDVLIEEVKALHFAVFDKL